MTRVLWATDIHLNFVSESKLRSFVEAIRAGQPDAVLLGGDIAESSDLTTYLVRLERDLGCPIYFVLGNHDFYFGSIESVRAQIAKLCHQHKNLIYLSQNGPVALAEGVGLLGHDGWADGRIGDYERSLVMMNDHRWIAELAPHTKQRRLQALHELGDEAARHVRIHLPAALRQFESVVFLTHVPPLREACWYDGKISDDQWSPHFTCKAVGDALLEIMRQWPTKQLTVLCGHTHGSGKASPLPNLSIHTGGADYGDPRVQRSWHLPPSQ